MVLLVGQEVTQAGQQERTEPALLAIHLGEIIFLKQAGEKALRQIFGICDVITQAPNISIQRMPISAAEPFHSRFSVRPEALAGGQHLAPVSGGKHFGLDRLSPRVGYW